jgi:hypothetical protein
MLNGGAGDDERSAHPEPLLARFSSSLWGHFVIRALSIAAFIVKEITRG